MKRFALLVLFMLALAAPALAQINPLVGDISVYADDQGSNCNIAANGGGAFMQPYIIQKFSAGGGATGARFKVTPAGGMTIIGFSTTFVPVGQIQTDLSLAYGVCINTTTVIAQIQIISNAASPACSWISVVNADNFVDPIATDCLFGEYPIKTGQAVINADGTCPCTIATEQSSWGKVKSLYR